MSPWKIIGKKIDKMQINFSHRQLSWSFSWVIKKCVGMSSQWSSLVFPWQQIKNCLSRLYQTLSTAVFATTLFVTKIMCCCVTHDATSSTLLNSTNEANTFLTMYNIIRFSRLLKLVSSNLKAQLYSHVHPWIWQLTLPSTYRRFWNSQSENLHTGHFYINHSPQSIGKELVKCMYIPSHGKACIYFIICIWNTSYAIHTSPLVYPSFLTFRGGRKEGWLGGGWYWT